MPNDVVGEFRGRTDGCAKMKVPSVNLAAYLMNIPKRHDDIRKTISDKAELLEQNPALKGLVTNYSASLGKTKALYAQFEKNLQASMNGQMSI